MRVFRGLSIWKLNDTLFLTNDDFVVNGFNVTYKNLSDVIAWYWRIP